MLTLQQFVADRKISTRTFAEIIGVDPSTATQILRGRRVPSIRTLRAIHRMAPDADLYLSVSHYASQSRTPA